MDESSNVVAKSLKLSGESIHLNLCYLGVSMFFFRYDMKHKQLKKIEVNWTSSKFKFFVDQDTVKKVKR